MTESIESTNSHATERTLLFVLKPSKGTPLRVVGIGASAGGFEALETFFTNMPPDTNLCVVVQHLSPAHKSLMVGLLSKYTRLTVSQAKEKLLSAIKKLISVNSEYQNKIQELIEVNNDINDLLSGTNFGVIFLARNLYVRKFTAAVKDVIHLMDFDIGRSIPHISLNVKYNTLEKDTATVPESLIPTTHESTLINEEVMSLRIFPYTTKYNTIRCIIITFVDIKKYKNASLRLAQRLITVNYSFVDVILTNEYGKIEFENFDVKQMIGYDVDEVKGQNICFLRSSEINQASYT